MFIVRIRELSRIHSVLRLRNDGEGSDVRALCGEPDVDGRDGNRCSSRDAQFDLRSSPAGWDSSNRSGSGRRRADASETIQNPRAKPRIEMTAAPHGPLFMYTRRRPAPIQTIPNASAGQWARPQTRESATRNAKVRNGKPKNVASRAAFPLLATTSRPERAGKSAARMRQYVMNGEIENSPRTPRTRYVRVAAPDCGRRAMLTITRHTIATASNASQFWARAALCLARRASENVSPRRLRNNRSWRSSSVTAL